MSVLLRGAVVSVVFADEGLELALRGAEPVGDLSDVGDVGGVGCDGGTG